MVLLLSAGRLSTPRDRAHRTTSGRELPRVQSLTITQGYTMKKLKLDIEALAVDLFEVEPEHRDAKGTVIGNDSVGSYTAPYRYCLNQPDTASCWC